MLYISLPSAFLPVGSGVISLLHERAGGLRTNLTAEIRFERSPKEDFRQSLAATAGFESTGRSPLPLQSNNPYRPADGGTLHCRMKKYKRPIDGNILNDTSGYSFKWCPFSLQNTASHLVKGHRLQYKKILLAYLSEAGRNRK